MSGNSWWIAVTQPSLERRAMAALEDEGFEVWLPTRLVKFKSRYMKQPVERAYPQFPGYLFVRSTGYRTAYRYERRNGYLQRIGLGTLAHDHHWRELVNVDCVKGLLSNDFRPSLFGDDEVAKLRLHLDDLANKAIDAAIWRVDDVARITDGPLAGFNATVVRGEQRGSVSVMMGLFGRTNVVEMPLSHLEKVA